MALILTSLKCILRQNLARLENSQIELQIELVVIFYGQLTLITSIYYF